MTDLPVAVQAIPLVLSIVALIEARRAVTTTRRQQPPETHPRTTSPQVDRLIEDIRDWDTIRRSEEWSDDGDEDY